MPNTITYTGELVTTSCWCGIHLAVPNDLYKLARANKGKSIYCPIGHQFVYDNTLEEQLADTKKRLSETSRRVTATRELLWAEERSHAATKGHVTRKKKELTRVKAGVCPCCARSFVNLRRHMENKHPDYAP